MKKLNVKYNRFKLFFYNLFYSPISLDDAESLFFFTSLYEYLKVYKDLILSLKSISEMNSKFKIFEKVIINMKKGLSFSESLEKLRIFDDTIMFLIQSGDCNNDLLQSIELVKGTLKNKIKRKNDIKNALIYPMFVFIVFNLVILLFSYQIIPSLVEVFLEINNNFLNEIKYLLYFILMLKILVLLMIFISIFSFLLYKFNKERFYKLLFSLPIIRDIMMDYYIILITSSLIGSLKNNLDFVTALNISCNSIKVKFIKEYILNIKIEIAQGKHIYEVLSKNRHISMFFIEIIKIGENIGDLQGALRLAHESFELKFEKKINDFLGYIPIILVGFLSVFLIMFVYLLFIPIYNLGV